MGIQRNKITKQVRMIKLNGLFELLLTASMLTFTRNGFLDALFMSFMSYLYKYAEQWLIN